MEASSQGKFKEVKENKEGETSSRINISEIKPEKLF